MTATTIPEEVGPSELLAYTGNDFYSVAAGAAPNGDDALRFTTHATTLALSARQQAFQAASASTHLLPLTANAMSFWIKRNASFSGGASLTTSSAGESGTTTTNLPLIMGVGSALGSGSTWPNLMWGMWASGTTSVQFGVRGDPANRIFCSSTLTLATGAWNFVVVNADAHDNSDAQRGRWEIFLNGNLSLTIAPVASLGYHINMLSAGSVSNMRFALGDPTQSRTAVNGAAINTNVFEIAKLTFHNQKLSAVDMLNMMESMYYGGAAT